MNRHKTKSRAETIVELMKLQPQTELSSIAKRRSSNQPRRNDCGLSLFVMLK